MEIVVVSVLVMLGILLLIAEVAFIPGVGVTGVLGVLSMLCAVAYAFSIQPLVGWLVLAVVALSVVVLIIWAVYGKSIDKMALKKSIDSSVQNPDSSALAVGDEGVAVTRLALVGEADFGGLQLEVSSACGFIDEGEAVCVARIADGTIYVRRK